MNDSVVSKMLRFPAMEDMIERLPKDDLLVLSGFLSSCIDKSLETIITAAKALAESGDTASPNQKRIMVIRESADQVLRGKARMSTLINSRLRILKEAAISEEIDQT